MHKLSSIALALLLGLCCTGIVSAADEGSEPGASIGGTQTEIAGETDGAHESAVRERVEAFGEQLKKVSLLGPADVLRQSIQTHYSGFVTPTRIAEWLAHPESAPGRLVSSPWPDRIDINDIEIHRIDGQMEAAVRGHIVEITSVENVDGGVAARRPIALAVMEIDGRWLIDDVSVCEEIVTYGEHRDVAAKRWERYFNASSNVRSMRSASWDTAKNTKGPFDFNTCFSMR